MSTPGEHLEFQWEELHKLEDELRMMQRWGVSETDPGYLRLMGAKGTAMGKLGLIQPRTTTMVSSLAGLSPGEIKLWADAELGWMTEARERPGALPVYKYVSDEIAEKVAKKELTHELEEFLLTPEVDIDN